MEKASTRLLRGLARAGATLLVILLLVPLLGLAVTLRVSDLGAAIERGLWTALSLSLSTTAATVAVLVVLGTPLAWWLGRAEGRLARMVEVVVRLPAVTPPAVAGVALLTAFGRGGMLGEHLTWLPEGGLPFTPMAVVIAQLFVATPFYVLPVADAFREIEEDLLWTARSLGASPGRVFFRICLPIAMPAVLGGLAVAWARALGEFGATLVFAGNFPGRTQTLPIAIYTAMEGDLGPARAMSMVLLVFAVVLFVGLRAAPLERALRRGIS